MSNNFNTNTLNKDEWLTPRYITDALGPFDLDPCSPITRPWSTARTHYTIEDDGLVKEWYGRVWCNPPYGKHTFTWLEKLAQHGRGIALIFCRTETKGFHAQIWDKADSIFFFKGRLKFCDINGKTGNTANAPSCLVSYSGEDTLYIEKAIKENKITGKLIYLRQ
jgi:hypothetical protein